MKSWKRITFVIFVLMGGTTFFSYWSINQFDQIFDNLSTSYLANTYSAYLSFKQKTEKAYTSPEISGGFATSTSSGQATSTGSADSTSSFDSAQDESLQASLGQTTTTPVIATSTNPELSFTFPPKDAGVYIGCTYPISWQSSTTIQSLETTLVFMDADIRKTVVPIESGLARENTIERNLQNLKWKVGDVRPGTYYIKVAKINGVEAVFRSNLFEINKIPRGFDGKEKTSICPEFSDWVVSSQF